MTIENLQIEVQATSEQAVNSLERLEGVLKRIDALGSSTGFDKLYQKLKKLASLDFSGTTSGLSGIERSVNRVSRSTARMEKFRNTIRRTVEETSDAYAKFTKLRQKAQSQFFIPKSEPFENDPLKRNFRGPFDGISSDRPPKYNNFYDSYKNYQSSEKAWSRDDFESAFGGSIGDGGPNWTRWNPWGSEELFDYVFSIWRGNDFSAVPNSHRLTDGTINLGNDKWREINKLEKLFSNLKSGIKDTVRAFKDFGSSMDSTNKKAIETNKTFRSMKTILMYSLMFSAVSAVTKGVTEGLQNVAMYSSEVNAVLTEYKTTILQLKNAIGSALIPVLRILYPFFWTLTNAIINLANAVNVFFSVFKGSFLKAKKYTDDYAKSLGKVKGMVGMDQINTLSQSYDYSKMFEEVDITPGEYISAAGTIMEVVTGLTLLQKLLTGKTWLSGLSNLKGLRTNIKGLGSKMKTLGSQIPPVVKNLIGAAGLVVGFIQAKTAAYDLAKALGSDSKDGLGSSIMSLVTGGVMAVAGGAMIGGPIGAAIGALVAFAGALVGAAQAQTELAYEMARTEYYDVQGRKITEVKTALDNYFASMNFDKQAEWIQTMTDAQLAYDDARLSYDLMWESIANKTVFDTSDIEGLTQAFNDLADAANAVNEANIGSLMASIRTGIELNITDALSDKLGGLLDKIQEAQLVLGQKVTGLSQEYQSVLSEITANGGVATPEQKDKLQSLRNDLSKFTLSDDTATERWNIEIDDALKNAINAGTDKDSVIANIKDLASDRDTYLDNLKTKYAADTNTLTQLIEMDKTQFGGQLGFSYADLATLDSSYQSQIDEVKRRYNEVLEQVIATYENNALDYDMYVTHFTEGKPAVDFFDTIYSGIRGLFPSIKDVNGDTGWEHNANKKLAKEQYELLEELKKYLLPGYATGGFPEDGLFMANSRELVGKFTNGRTAVANNEQIIEGIKRGVKEANMESGGNGGNWIIQLVDTDGRVKSETIISATERRNRRDGKTIIPIGT